MGDPIEHDDEPGLEDDPLVAAAREKAQGLQERVERLKESAGGDWVEHDETTGPETGPDRQEGAEADRSG